MDKGYYDYDYQAAKEEEKQVLRAPKTYEEQQRQFRNFGFGKVKKYEPTTAERLQAEVMREERKKQQG